MRQLILLSIICLLFQVTLYAQTNEWHTQYVTFDNTTNGTLNRTSSVAVVDSNDFVALVTRGSVAGGNLINYLVGYVDADSANGRLGNPTGTGVAFWEYILDHVDFADAWQIAGGPNNLVYLANNDVNHNILVFELTPTEVASAPYRMETGTEEIWAIEVDANGYVYVCALNGTAANTAEVKVYPPVTDPNAAWGTTHDSPPIATIDLPDGVYRGITVSGDGSQVFISKSSERSMLKYTGSPANGYTLDPSFNLTLDPNDLGIREDSTTFIPTLLGLAYMDDPGLVIAATDSIFYGGETSGYRYGRLYIIDPTTGANLDTIDQARWNFEHAGDYSTGSNNGLWSGFASSYDVDVEATESALYAQSWFGWQVEKWLFDGDLSVLLDIKQVTANIPKDFALKQNYPNPFNPATTIEFDVRKAGQVTLEIYNLMGQKVATLIDEKLNPGIYQAVFDGSTLASGIYFYTLKADDFSAVKKMTLLK